MADAERWTGAPPAGHAGDAPVLRRRRAERGGRSRSGAGAWAHARVALAVLVAMAVPGVVTLVVQHDVLRTDRGPAPAPRSVVASRTPAPGGPSAPATDVDGDGRRDRVHVHGQRIEVVTSGATVVYEVGRPGDQVVIGDWDCDGTATPLLYRPSAGVVHRYDGWPSAAEPLAPTSAPAARDGTAHVVGEGACDAVVIR